MFPNWREGGIFVFAADPVNASVVSFRYVIFWTSGLILTILALINSWEGCKELIRFGDRYLNRYWVFWLSILKTNDACAETHHAGTVVIIPFPYLNGTLKFQILSFRTLSLAVPYIVNVLVWNNEELIRFCIQWPDFQNHHRIKAIKINLFRMICLL